MSLHKHLLSIALALGFAVSAHAATQFYSVTNLVSDGSVPANVTDPNLINPWGVAINPAGAFWVANNGTNTATIYRPDGTIIPLVVSVPGNPTGQIFNATSDFGGNVFIFDGEGGQVSGWKAGTTSSVLLDNSSSNAVFKGLATGSSAGQNFLYATDFHNDKIDVISANLAPASLPATAFTDPNIPTGFAPFNIQNINGKLYVTYAKQDAVAHDDVAGAGNGFVNVFDTAGNLLGRLTSNGPLNSPWGLAQAPANFGQFSNDILVGNFGDGKINAFDPTTGQFKGALSDKNGNPIVNGDLWDLTFGDGNVGQSNQLFFTAGIKDESQGLFGRIDAASGAKAIPLPNMLYVLPFALLLAGAAARRMTTKEA